jgi:hypothetical protein
MRSAVISIPSRPSYSLFNQDLATRLVVKQRKKPRHPRVPSVNLGQREVQ